MFERESRGGVTLVRCGTGPVVGGFTERTGGVSKAPFSSLNLGAHVGDDPAAVAENRRRVLSALDAEDLEPNLLVPNQVHGDRIAVVRAGDAGALDAVRTEIAEGADGIVCTAPDVPVLLCFADCVPVILSCEGGFAVVHSGWRGTLARISAKAARVLAEETGCDVAGISAFIGPHILGDEYEVSCELMRTFADEFATIDADGGRMLDLSAAIVEALGACGVPADRVFDSGLSTMRDNDRFFSYRREEGHCGRHGAIALMRA